MNSRIVIIGGGAAGISALSKLLENGYKNVTLLEAEDRIGGRLHTVPFASNVVDLGAQWCHGEKDNVVYGLVKSSNVLEETSKFYLTSNYINSQGTLFPEANDLEVLAFEILQNCEKDVKGSKGSLGSYFVEKYHEALQTEKFKHISSELAQEFLENFHKFENSIEASDSWFETSASGYLEYWECEGNNLLNWKDKGYGYVLDFITKKLPDPSKDLKVEEKIILNKEVREILWNHEPLKITCSDGSIYDADHVILTVSLGVLKENYQKLFVPQLPALKQQAIQGLSIGTVDKIFLEWEKPFWEANWSGFMLMWTKEDSDTIRKTDNAWLEDVFSFWPVSHQPNILCGWICGPNARRMEFLDDQTIQRGLLFLLEKFLGNKMKIPEPKRILPTRWSLNPHFRGSYSFRSLTTDLLRTSARDLAHPLYNCLGTPSILFAGEATHDHYYSTVHGAVESGFREAKRLIDFYKMKQMVEEFEDNSLNKKDDPVDLKHYEVMILGAGLAGLGAAQILSDGKIDFKVLEGQSRVGGRVQTVEMLDVDGKVPESILIEDGAQWLHGKQNALYELAQKLNIIRPELSEEAEGDYVRDDGLTLNEFFVRKVDFIVGQILEECEAMVEHKKDKNAKFPESIEVYLNQRFQEEIDRKFETPEERVLAIQLLDWHKRFQIIDNSCFNLDEVSVKNWGNYSFNGESCQTHVNVRNGLSQIPNYLFQKLKDKILLNKKVDLVSWKESQQKFLVQCSDGSTYSCNHLICTFSIGVLHANHKRLFSPELPKRHADVIESIGFGGIDKIFFYFEKKWWPDGWKGLQLLYSDQLNDDSHWTRYISGFDVVYPAPENTILGWIGGKGAVTMEKLSDQEIMTECVKIMRKFTGNQGIPMPSKFHCSRWNSNEFLRGAYSFTHKNSDKIESWEKIVSEPIVNGKPGNVLLFAGEACSEQFFSTIHGAFLSGIEQSKKLLKFIANQKCHTNVNSACQSKL